jgi:hypothetical protein
MATIVASEAGDGRFEVDVEEDGHQHVYQVSVPDALADRLGAEPAAVARATLAFLLDREPPGAILASFDCSVVSRYFPEYEDALPGYLTGPGSPDRAG